MIEQENTEKVSNDTNIGPSDPVSLLERTEARKSNILKCYDRIANKLKNEPDSVNAEAWKKRLKEYDASLECIEFTLKTGVYVKVQNHRGIQ